MIAWAVIRATGAIVGKYAERFWFSKVWRDDVQAAKVQAHLIQKKFDAFRDEVSNERVTYRENSVLFFKIALERDQLAEEVVRLRLELRDRKAC